MDLAAGPSAELYVADRSVDRVSPRAVLLATGTRERPRSARLIPGERPAGVYTTGALQQLARAGRFRGTRAVIVGAEHVSFSAVLTLAHAGCATVALVTPERPPPDVRRTGLRHRRAAPGPGDDRLSRWSRSWDGAGCRRGGRAGPAGPARNSPATPSIFTGDWVPDHELARRSGLAIDRGTRAPTVESMLRLDRPGWFAAGNLFHGAETADVCAARRSSCRSSVSCSGWATPTRPGGRSAGVPVDVAPPLCWISPNRVRPR